MTSLSFAKLRSDPIPAWEATAGAAAANMAAAPATIASRRDTISKVVSFRVAVLGAGEKAMADTRRATRMRSFMVKRRRNQRMN
jgi:hypothetical protein